MTCELCGAARATLGEHAVRRTFGELVVSVTVPAEVCDACGESLIADDDLARVEHAVTRALVAAGSMHPNALRWLRKAADLRSMDLAELLGVAPEAVLRWEHGSRTIDRAALALVASLALDALDGITTTRDRLRALGASPATGEVLAMA